MDVDRSPFPGASGEDEVDDGMSDADAALTSSFALTLPSVGTGGQDAQTQQKHETI
jgi:hypothetical protein